MDDVLDDIIRAIRRCERTAAILEREPFVSAKTKLQDAISRAASAWSGSWLGYQANVYTTELRPRRPGEHFDTEWGGQGRLSDRTAGQWCEYNPDTVEAAILSQAGLEDMTSIQGVGTQVKAVFEDVKVEMLATLDVLLNGAKDASLKEKRSAIAKMDSCISRHLYVDTIRPTQVMSRDTRASQGGLRVPPHVNVDAVLVEQISTGLQVRKLADELRYVAKYLQKQRKVKGRTVARTDGRIFIGHGGSLAWRALKDFIQERLGLQHDEYMSVLT